MEEQPMTLAERRRALNMSLGECARKCGMKTFELSKIERGSSTIPEDSEMETIATALNWTVEELRAGLPSPEDAERISQRTVDSLLVMASAHEDAKRNGLRRGHGGTGEIECPVCKGRLRYSVAACNGHMWGACSNQECVRWME